MLEAFEYGARPRIGMTSNFIYMGHPTSVLEQAWDSLWQCEPFQPLAIYTLTSDVLF